MRSLSTQLVVAFVVAIIATTVAAGAPAYWLVLTELEQQAWARVADGGRVTLALLTAEQDRLVNMATLAAQRPTLQRLLQQGNAAALSEYVEIFRAGVDLDILIVYDSSGEPLVEDELVSPYPDPTRMAATFCVVPRPTSALGVLASQPVRDSRSGRLLGYVTVGALFDDNFVRQLAVTTGLSQSIVLAGERVATSMTDVPSAVDAEAVGRAMSSGQAEMVAVTLPGTRYYTVLLPLRDAQGQPAALAEVALPIDGLVVAETRALLILIGSTLLVIGVSSALAGSYARRLTAPLRQLTGAALRISQGDLTTPVPIPREPLEIATLATALEENRVSTRRALDDLSQAKAWSETLVQSIVEGIVTFDAEGRITFFNQGAERITGWSSDEVLGQPLDHVFRLSDGNDEPFMARTPPYGGKRQISVLTHSGRPVTLAVTGARLIPPGRSAVQVALVLRDITEEEAVRHLRSYFMANISHEFRTPLAALNASVELLLDEIEHLSSAEMRELLNSVHLSVTGLQTLIDNLLESTSIEAGRFSIRRRPTAINEVIVEAVQVMTPLLHRRRQRLVLPDLSPLPLVDGDPTRLTQVLVNLLSNASKYSPMEQEIELNLERVDDRSLRVSVADRGVGIPPAERADLFRRFVRLGDPDGAQYGIGLGLSVVKAIVEEHGGDVGVDERPGGGSIFWFTIPITEGTP